MEKKDRQYTYFKGEVQEILQKEYKDKETGESKKYWSVVLTNKDTGEKMFGAIFAPSKFKKTPDNIQELVGTEIQCSYFIDEQNKKHVFLFGEREQKESFLSGKLLTKNTEYAIKIKKADAFQAKESKNIFIKYELDPSSIIKLCDPKEIDAFIDGLGFEQDQAVAQARKKLEDKRPTFKDYDWTLINQVSSIGKNSNGKMVQAINMPDGRVFDIIKINLETFAKIVLKNHNDTSKTKWNKEKTIETVNKAIAEQDITKLKELANSITGTEVFLNVKSGKLDADRQFGKIKAYLPKDSKLIK